jgi:hypothetical protein
MRNRQDPAEVPLCDACRRIPLSHLALDIAEPLEGWLAFFEKRGVIVMDDHLGRPSVRRHVLGDLIAEQREREARLVQEAAERAARMTAPIGAGVPALNENASAYESLLAVGAVSPVEEFGFAPKPRFLAEALEEGQMQQAAEREAVRRRKEER